MIVNVIDNWKSVENLYIDKILPEIKNLVKRPPPVRPGAVTGQPGAVTGQPGAVKRSPRVRSGAVKRLPPGLPPAILVFIRKNVNVIAIGKPPELWSIAQKYETVALRIVNEEVVRYLVKFCSDVELLFNPNFLNSKLYAKYSILVDDDEKKEFLKSAVGKIAFPSGMYLADSDGRKKIIDRAANIIWGEVSSNPNASAASVGNILRGGLKTYVFDAFFSGLNRMVLGMFLRSYETKLYDVAYDICDGLDIPVCPYCNMSFTSHVASDSGKFRPEFDHFYPKAIYPVLTLSLYNLIPSCRECNDIKKAKVFFKKPYFHPLGNAGVSFFVKQPWRAMWFRRNSKQLSSGLEICIYPCVEQESLDALLLRERYSKLKGEVIEILGSMYYYKLSMVSKLYPKDPHWRRVVMRGVNKYNYKRRIMGKMILDLAKVAKI